MFSAGQTQIVFSFSHTNTTSVQTDSITRSWMLFIFCTHFIWLVALRYSVMLSVHTKTPRVHSNTGCLLLIQQLYFTGRLEQSECPQTRINTDFFEAYLLDLIAACAAARRATGTRNGEHETQSRPRVWQNSTETGSPPCSPQIPQ